MGLLGLWGLCAFSGALWAEESETPPSVRREEHNPLTWAQAPLRDSAPAADLPEPAVPSKVTELHRLVQGLEPIPTEPAPFSSHLLQSSGDPITHEVQLPVLQQQVNVLAQTLQSVRVELFQLQEENGWLRQELERARDEAAFLKEKIQRESPWGEVLAAKDAELKRLQEEELKARRMIRELKLRLYGSAEGPVADDSELQELKAKLRVMSDREEKNRRTIEQLELQIETLKQGSQFGESHLKTLEKEREGLFQALEQATEEAAQIRARNRALEADLARLRAQGREAALTGREAALTGRKEVSTSTSEPAQFERLLEVKEEQLRQTKEDLNLARETIQRLETQVGTLVRSDEEAGIRWERFRSQRETLVKALDEARRRNEALESKKEEVTRLLEEEKRVAEQTSSQAKAREERDSRTIDTLQQRVEEITQAKAEEEEQIRVLSFQRNEAIETLEQIRKELAEARAQNLADASRHRQVEEQLQARMGVLTQAQTETQSRIGAVETQRQALEEEKRSLEATAQQAKAQQEQDARTIESLEVRIHELTQAQAEVQASLGRLERDRQQLSRRFQKAGTQLENFRAKLKASESEHQQAMAEAQEGFDQETARLKAAADALAQTTRAREADLLEKAKQSQRNVAELADRLKKLSQERRKRAGQIEALARERDELVSRLDQARSQLQTLRAQSESEMESYRKTQQELTGRLKELTQLQAQRDASIQMLTEERDALQGKLEEAVRQMADFRSQSQAAQETARRTIAEFQSRVEALEQVRAQRDASIQMLTEERDALQEKLKETDQEMVELQRQSQAAQETAGRTIAEFQSRLEALEQVRAQRDARIEALEGERSRLSEELVQVRQEVQEAHAQNSKMENASRRAVGQLQTRLEGLLQAEQDLNRQVETLRAERNQTARALQEEQVRTARLHEESYVREETDRQTIEQLQLSLDSFSELERQQAAQLQALEEDRARISEQLQQAQQEVAVLRAQGEERENRYHQMVQALEGQMALLQQERADRDERIRQMEEKGAELQSALEGSQQEATRLRVEGQAAQAGYRRQVDDLQLQVEALISAQAEREEQIQALETKQQELSQSLGAAHEETQALTVQMEAERAQSAQKVEELERQLRQLHQAQVNRDLDIRELETKRNLLLEELDEARRETQVMQARNQSLESESLQTVEQLQRRINTLTQAQTEARFRIEALEAQRDALSEALGEQAEAAQAHAVSH